MDQDKPRQDHPAWAPPRSVCREIDTGLHALRGLGRGGGALCRILGAPRSTSIDVPRRAVEATSAAGRRRPRHDGRRTGPTADDLRRTVTVAGSAAALDRVSGAGSHVGAGLAPAVPVRVRDAWPARFGVLTNSAERQGRVIRVACSRSPRGLQAGWHEDGPVAPLDGAHLFGLAGPGGEGPVP